MMQPDYNKTDGIDTAIIVFHLHTQEFHFRYLDIYDNEVIDTWLPQQIFNEEYFLFKEFGVDQYEAVKKDASHRILLELKPEEGRPFPENNMFPILEADVIYTEKQPLEERRAALALLAQLDPDPEPEPELDPELEPLQVDMLRMWNERRDETPEVRLARLLLNRWNPQPRPVIDWNIALPIQAAVPLRPLECCWSLQKPESSLAPPMKHVAQIMIADAISKEQTCPISLNPISSDTAVCVAPCYHVFEKEAIEEWFATTQGEKLCPTCRGKCTL